MRGSSDALAAVYTSDSLGPCLFVPGSSSYRGNSSSSSRGSKIRSSAHWHGVVAARACRRGEVYSTCGCVK